MHYVACSLKYYREQEDRTGKRFTIVELSSQSRSIIIANENNKLSHVIGNVCHSRHAKDPVMGQRTSSSTGEVLMHFSSYT